MNRASSDDFASEFRLDPAHLLALRGLQVAMMRNDVAAERRETKARRKTEQLGCFTTALADEVLNLANGADLPTAAVHDDGSVDVNRLVELAPELAEQITDRSHAIVVVVELMTFNPWAGGLSWAPKAREKAIVEAADHIGGVTPDDFAAVTKEFEALMKQLRRKSIRWGRVAAVSVVGLGVGVVTAGWAAGPVGAAIGSTMGLSGAAATSAGLAALGGGSIAAGGFGVAGGTMLITGVGGVAAAGAAATGARFSRFGSAEIMLEAIKLDLISRVILADATDKDQKQRRVIESLQHLINEQATRVNLLSERIVKLKREKTELAEENSSLREELKEVRAERDAARQAKSTLEVVLDRVSAGVDNA